ncbi:MAG: hypothetical protein CM15mP58_02570 [Burkholderiaceae bacterium]|nr:MAG: hypothetical protein CM15mP58_02570 [Burkholderiaceae bacterium]
MRYGNPSIDSAILRMMGPKRSKAVHFASLSTVLGSTTATVFDKVFESIAKLRNPPP